MSTRPRSAPRASNSGALASGTGKFDDGSFFWPIRSQPDSASADRATAPMVMLRPKVERIVMLLLPGKTIGIAKPPRRLSFPSAMMPLFAAGSNSDVTEAVARHLFAAIDVAQVDEQFVRHARAKAGEVERTEGVPFGDDRHRIGAVGGGIGALLHLDIGHHWRRYVHAFGIVGGDPRAGVDQRLDDREAGRIAHVVGARLERQPEQSDGL